jgi:hypothetical protein
MNILKKINHFHILVFISIAIIFEFITKFFGFYYNQYYWSFGTVFKLLFFLYFLQQLIKGPKKEFLIPLILLSSFLVVELFIYDFSVKIDFYFYSTRYLYFLIFLFLLTKHNNLSKNQVINFLTFFLIVNSVMILSGIIFDISIFKTYEGGRIGFDGVFNVVSDVNYVYASYILICIFYHNVHDYKKLTLINILVGVLTGTKVILVLSMIYLIFRLYKYSKKALTTLLVTISVLVFVFHRIFMKYIKLIFEEHFLIYETDGFWGAISSTRFTNALNSIELFLNKFPKKSNFIYGKDFIENRVEMELLDLLLFWGILGSIIYLAIFIFLNKKFIIEKKDIYIICIMLLISFFGGKFLTNFISLLILYTFFTSKKIQIN